MSDDDPLVLTPENLGVAVMNPERDVIVTVDLGRWQEFVGRPLVLRMTPAETRRFAEALSRKADEAEAGLPRA